MNLLCSSFSDKAERAEIRLTVDTVLPEVQYISDMELCANMFNGLENAFCAGAELENDCRWIELHSSIRQDKLLVEIRNPYVGQVSFEDEMPVSDQEGHGYGCWSIRSIAQQHRGVCMFVAEDGHGLCVNKNAELLKIEQYKKGGTPANNIEGIVPSSA